MTHQAAASPGSPSVADVVVDPPEARAPQFRPLLLPPFAHEGEGVVRPDDVGCWDDGPGSDQPPRRSGWKRLIHPMVLFVLLPTLLIAAFEFLVAADQYESTAQFIVRTPQESGSMNSLGQMLGLGGTTVNADAHGVDAYLLSHDAVTALGPNRLTTLFRRPEADVFTRLWFAAPQPETLLNYYRGKVHIMTASDTGITTLSVRTYRPGDAKMLADDLLRLGEARVNELNQRVFASGLAAANRQAREAAAAVEKIEDQITRFRQKRGDADPERSGAAQIQLAAALQQTAAQARAQFDAMAAVLPHTAPQYAATARRVAALERQVATAKARLAGPARSLAGSLGEYEKLQMQQQFASKQYEAAQTSYQLAREQLLKQQLFIVPVVKPDLPGKALYPERLSIIATAFFGLLFAYAIGWLILAGVREHAE